MPQRLVNQLKYGRRHRHFREITPDQLTEKYSYLIPYDAQMTEGAAAEHSKVRHDVEAVLADPQDPANAGVFGPLGGTATFSQGSIFACFSDSGPRGPHTRYEPNGRQSFKGATSKRPENILFSVYYLHKDTRDFQSVKLIPNGDKVWALHYYAAAKARGLNVKGYSPSSRDRDKAVRLEAMYKRMIEKLDGTPTGPVPPGYRGQQT